MSGKKRIELTEDQIRNEILRLLFEIHKSAKSPASAAVGIRDIQSALKESHQLKQQEVASNLDYLVQKGWVGEKVTARSFTTKTGTTQNSQQTKYKISDIGIDRLEKASLFRKTPLSGTINITNIRGVTVVGDGNVVNANFTEVVDNLRELRDVLEKSPKLNDEQRLEVLADIDALEVQLQKPKLNVRVIELLWQSISAIATIAGFADATFKIGELIQPFLTNL